MDRRSAASSSSTAPYGSACLNCSRSKCKCVVRKVGEPCERCQRLHKDCHRPSSSRRSIAKKPALSHTARLEEKLDSLVSLLKSHGSQANESINGASTTSPTPDATILEDVHQAVRTTEFSPDPICGLDHTSTSPRSVYRDAMEPSPAEAEEYLSRFVAEHLIYAPFIYLPSTMTARQLREERPFLWLCIMMITSKSLPQQDALNACVLRVLGQELFIEFRKDLDLLLGVLVYVSWTVRKINNRLFVSLLTQVATSLIFDLGLNKPVRNESLIVAYFMPNKYPKRSTLHSLEERRAVLGCFLISSSGSRFFQKTDGLRWTSHMDDCLRVLDERNECAGDELLVHQVRMQLIVERIALNTWYDEVFNSAGEDKRPPSDLYFQVLESQLQQVQKKLLPQMQHIDIALAHLYSTQLSINESAVSDVWEKKSSLTFQQSRRLYGCLDAIKSWFEIFFAIPPAKYAGLSCMMFHQLMHCIVMLFRLSTLEIPGWDVSNVRKTVNVLQVADRIIDNASQGLELVGTQDDDSVIKYRLSLALKMFKSARGAWEAKVGSKDTTDPSLPTPPDAQAFDIQDVPLDLPDDNWLMEFFPISERY